MSFKTGYFGEFGGRFVPETLFYPLLELEEAYNQVVCEEVFQRELRELLERFVGRPTPLFFASHLSEMVGCKVYLKREDLCHTGSHKINNTLGQVLLTKRLGKKRVIAETGAGQHGVATATAAALLGLECDVYMGEEDMRRQAINVVRMELLGARVIPVTSGSRTLKDAINEALRDWVANVDHTHYVIGSVVGPHPFPSMVREFQRVIGDEAKAQILETEGRLPTHCIACVGGGSNAMGLFNAFKEHSCRLIGVEAKGAETLSGGGEIGVLHGFKSYFLQDQWGQITPTDAIAAGLDYPGVGPEHAFFKDTQRCTYRHVTPKQAVEAFKILARTEGIIPALESAHAIAGLLDESWNQQDLVLICLSGRGDKDMNEIIEKVLQ